MTDRCPFDACDGSGFLYDEESNTAVREDEVEKFKEFLDSVSPDDFKAT